MLTLTLLQSQMANPAQAHKLEQENLLSTTGHHETQIVMFYVIEIQQ